LLGHGWAVTFGSLGSSFLALMATSGLPGEVLAGDAAMLLLVACLGCGLGVLLTAGGREALRRRWLFLLVMTAIMGGVQWALAIAGLWTMAALGGGLAGLIATIVYFRVSSTRHGEAPITKNGRLWRAFLPYLILIVVVVVGQLVLAKPLDSVQLSFNFPEVATAFGWRTPAGPGRSISIFGHAGALLLYASILAFLWFRWQRPFVTDKPYRAETIVRKTVRGSVKSTISIVTLVAMALTMQHAGMTQLLAEGLSSNTGRFFPLLSPLIGALGAFVTGSNTNSNVVFAQLQQQTALALGVSVSLILAAQTAGGAIGSIFAPAKVVVGASTVDGADDGRVLRLATAYGMGIIIVTGVLVWLLT
jgi:lactate permease